MRKNPFRPLTEEEKTDRESQKKAIAESIEATLKSASECLDDPKFRKYREDYEALRKDVFEKLAEPMYPDPIQDAHYLRSCINSVLVLGRLLDGPKKDIRRA